MKIIEFVIENPGVSGFSSGVAIGIFIFAVRTTVSKRKGE